MPARVSPTERIRGEIDALFAEDRDLGEVLEDVARLGARLILQTALEAEVTEFLGREARVATNLVIHRLRRANSIGAVR